MRRLRRWYIPWSRTTSVQGPAAARRPAPARIHGFMTDAARCEPHRPSSRHWRRRLVQVLQQQYNICFTGSVLTTCLPRVCFIATAVRRSHSSCYYYYFDSVRKKGLLVPTKWHFFGWYVNISEARSTDVVAYLRYDYWLWHILWISRIAPATGRMTAVLSHVWSAFMNSYRDPHFGSGVKRTDLIHFMDGCHKRWLNQPMSDLS